MRVLQSQSEHYDGETVRVPDLGDVPGEPAGALEPGDWWQLHRDRRLVVTRVEQVGRCYRRVHWREDRSNRYVDPRSTGITRLRADRLIARIPLAERRARLEARAERLITRAELARRDGHRRRADDALRELREVTDPELEDADAAVWASA